MSAAGPLHQRQEDRDLRAFIGARPGMVRTLDTVAGLGLPDCWIGAGFVRNAVWDWLHGLTSPLEDADVDVIFFDGNDDRPERDAGLERALAATHPDIRWSVRNQARMHMRNGDAAYTDSGDAVRHWPEYCSAVAARLCADGRIDISAPYGTADLFDLIVRPTPAFAAKMAIYRERARRKNWRGRWPGLQIMGLD